MGRSSSLSGPGANASIKALAAFYLQVDVIPTRWALRSKADGGVADGRSFGKVGGVPGFENDDV